MRGWIPAGTLFYHLLQIWDVKETKTETSANKTGIKFHKTEWHVKFYAVYLRYLRLPLTRPPLGPSAITQRLNSSFPPARQGLTIMKTATAQILVIIIRNDALCFNLPGATVFLHKLTTKGMKAIYKYFAFPFASALY